MAVKLKRNISSKEDALVTIQGMLMMAWRDSGRRRSKLERLLVKPELAHEAYDDPKLAKEGYSEFCLLPTAELYPIEFNVLRQLCSEAGEDYSQIITPFGYVMMPNTMLENLREHVKNADFKPNF